jgi:hypothetical protein
MLGITLLRVPPAHSNGNTPTFEENSSHVNEFAATGH